MHSLCPNYITIGIALVPIPANHNTTESQQRDQAMTCGGGGHEPIKGCSLSIPPPPSP